MPLLLPTQSLPPRTANAEGYQPTGRNPSTSLLARSATRTTATSLLSALATNSIWFSRSSANAFGVEPSGAFGVKAVEIRSMVWRVRVSITTTVLSLAQETNRRPSFDNVMSFGLSPTTRRPVTRRLATSMMLTESLPQLETYSVCPLSLSTRAYGFTSTGMRCISFPVSVSNTTTSLGPAPVPRFAAKSSGLVRWCTRPDQYSSAVSTVSSRVPAGWSDKRPFS